MPNLQSAAAGDMNPASERNSHCKHCGLHDEERTSWAYEIERNGVEMIQSDKIKVSCENIEEEEDDDDEEEDVSGDWKDVEESTKENSGNGDIIDSTELRNTTEITQRKNKKNKKKD